MLSLFGIQSLFQLDGESRDQQMNNIFFIENFKVVKCRALRKEHQIGSLDFHEIGRDIFNRRVGFREAVVKVSIEISTIDNLGQNNGVISAVVGI